MSSTFGRLFCVTTWGESHGPALGCTIDGCPAGLPLSEETIQPALDRRRPNQSPLTTTRKELDRVQILAGVFEGRTLGSPISLLIPNQDADSKAYDSLKHTFRPGHADHTTWMKYGHRDWRGGGRASARETAARVAAGEVARALLEHDYRIEILAWVEQVGGCVATVDRETVSRRLVERSATRCPDEARSREMEQLILSAAQAGDSLGGVVGCLARNVPAGWGEPTFDKLTARLAAAMMSIPASRGFEVGWGFASAGMSGSQHNDPLTMLDGRVTPLSNNAGGIQGGISNGQPVFFRVAFKPTPSIRKQQETVDREGRPISLTLEGRHDPTVLPRAVPVVEAMCALVLADAALQQRRLLFEGDTR